MVVAQKPNLPAFLTAAGLAVSLVPPMRLAGLIVAIVCGAWWSGLEITSGVNWLRKTFGWLALGGVILLAAYVIHLIWA